jgi:hypothetical protein
MAGYTPCGLDLCSGFFGEPDGKFCPNRSYGKLVYSTSLTDGSRPRAEVSGIQGGYQESLQPPRAALFRVAARCGGLLAYLARPRGSGGLSPYSVEDINDEARCCANLGTLTGVAGQPSDSGSCCCAFRGSATLQGKSCNRANDHYQKKLFHELVSTTTRIINRGPSSVACRSAPKAP